MSPLVSLVVPIYNVEEYLPECLASIRTQTVFERTEVILVDDGSTDGSGAIASQFASNYANVTLVVRENGGLGAARNSGIDVAHAPTIAFLDSDDLLPPDSLERRLVALTDDVDIAVGNMRTFPTATVWPWSRGIAASARVLEGVETFPELLSNSSACNKLFRTSFFSEGRNRFPERVHFEDGYVVVPAMLAARRVAVIPDVIYDYRKRLSADSIMDGVFLRPQNYWDHLGMVQKLGPLLETLSPERRLAAQAFMVRSMQGFLLRAPLVLQGNALDEFITEAREAFADVDVDTILEHTLDLRHRVPFYALATGDRDLFKDPLRQIEGIEVVNKQERLALKRGAVDPWSPLLRLTRPRAFVEAARAVGTELRLHGRLDLPGVPVGDIEETTTVVITERGRQRSTRSRVRVREAWSERRPITTVEWECSIAPAEFRSGSHLLDARIETRGGSFALRLRPSLGMQRSSRDFHLPTAVCRLEPYPDDRSRLLVDAGPARGRDQRWARRNIKTDLAAMMRRRPFAWWRMLLSALELTRLPRNIWLLGERADTAQDNGFAFFRWLQQNAPHVRARYVLRSNSPAWRNLDQRKGVVRHGSFRHKWSILRAKVLISSQDIDAYMLPESWNRNAFRRHLAPRLGHRRVFLQHGVTINGVGPALHRGVTGLDVLICSTEEEHHYLRDTTGYDRELALTGMPRFDSLVRRPDPRTVLIAPTWRKYLVAPSYAQTARDPGTFIGSDYERFFTQLLTHPRLSEVLERHQLHAVFLPHYEVARYFAELVAKNDRVSVVDDGGSTIGDLIRGSAIVLSDYSSTILDAAYLGVPVVQMPFDLEDFHERHYPRGWFDNGRGEIGPVALTAEDAIDLVDRYAGTLVPDPGTQARIDELFPHRDTSNSRRVYDAVVRALQN